MKVTMKMVTTRTVVGHPRTVGERLLSARAKAGLSQREAARIAGISYSAISHYETGFSAPGLTAAAALAKAYGVSLEWLATGATPERGE